ncbi:MAG: ribosome silencing factor [Polyangiaceae bacterium]|nr:ribosome silencing factor [Polyangiaceae bacterium]MCL4755997.1 ribosome silencing factor [Myxococcales bacterium]
MSQKKTPTKKKQSPHKKTRARTRAPLPKPERGKPGTRSHKAPRVPSVPPPSPSEGARKVALLAAQAGLDKKAAGIEIIDVTGKVDYADYLVLMTGHSDRHVAAIAGGVDEMLGKNGFPAISIEGLPAARWVLIDFVDVVVHVFEESARTLYDLDGLWLDARRVPMPGDR